MKKVNKAKIENAIALLNEALLNEKIENGVPRVGDAGTPLSIKSVIDDEEKRSVVIVWEDGKTTKAVADPADEYDFNIGFGLCIAKKVVMNLSTYSAAIKASKRYIYIPPKDKQ